MQAYAVKDYSATITGATYRAFDSVLSEGYDFSSIIRVDKNSQGEIVLLSTDSYGVNKIASDISKAGINQTRHTLMLNLRCETAVLTRTGNKTVKNEISMLIYDNLIVGKVPSVLISPMIVGQG